MSFIADDKWTCPDCNLTLFFWGHGEAPRLQREKEQIGHGKAHSAARAAARAARIRRVA
jgi:hypothetical protein